MIKLISRKLPLAMVTALLLGGCEIEEEINLPQENINVETIKLIGLSDSQVAIYYKREDGNYDGWGLHLWNGEGCGNYASPTMDAEEFGAWDTPYPADNISDDYGAYYVLDYEVDSGDCLNFILHKGNEKALGDANSAFDLSQDSRHAFTFHGFPDVLYDADAKVSIALTGAAAHWVDETTIAWTPTGDYDTVELVSSVDGSISFDASDDSISGGEILSLTPISTFEQAVYDKFPKLGGYLAWQLPNTSDAKALLKTQLIAVAKNVNGGVVAMTKVQIPGVVDQVYTSAEDDADEQALGLSFDSGVEFSLWAPTAQSVMVHIVDDTFQAITDSPFMMTEDEHGIWHHQADSSVDQLYYRYELVVYHPNSDEIETVITTDPYSLSLSTNSQYSQIVDLTADYTKPMGWNEHVTPTVEAPEDITLYEGHVRDFSAFEANLNDGTARGKYAAFSEDNSDGVNHLKSLASAGMNHFHLLPVFDIATVNEDDDKVVNLTDTVAKLCELKASAAICSDDSISATDTLTSVLANLDPSTADAQALVEDMRSVDSFNWGYDPFHYTVPEGSYAQNPQGEQRIVEFRQMVQSLHVMGYRVVMDVVYNHTNASGLNNNSVLDKVVPGYFHRLSPVNGKVEMSSCCDNTATEHVMMAKLMSDSLVTWAQHYGIDGFRFDLMGHQPKTAMLASREAVWAIDSDNYFYGEGWNFGEVANDALFVQAVQKNLSGTSIGTFSDRMRDAVRGGGPFEGGSQLRSSQGLGNGLGVVVNDLASNLLSEVEAEHKLSMDQARVVLAGTLSDFVLVDNSGATVTGAQVPYHDQNTGYALDPADLINYVSKHDNQTLWDNNQYRIDYGVTIEDRVRMQMLSLAYPMYAQGIPFMQMGSEILRSKSMARDSYDFGDWFNKVDFSKQSNNYNVGLPPADKDQDNWSLISEVIANNNGADTPSMSDIEMSQSMFEDMLSIRTTSVLYRLRTAQDIMQRVDFHNVGENQEPGLIVMSIDDGTGLTDLDANIDALVTIFNHDDVEHSFTIAEAVGFTLHSIQANGMDEQVKTSIFDSGTFTVPALTVAVFVKVQAGVQGTGLAVNTSNKDFSNIKPFASNAIYLQGSMNGWQATDMFSFEGNGNYEITLDLEAGDYEFKVSDANWSIANYGVNGDAMTLDSSAALASNGNNITLSIDHAGAYKFTFNASDKNAATLVVVETAPPAPFGETTIYLRGDMNEWGSTDSFTYTGDYKYQLAVHLEAGSYGFKVGDSAWSGDTSFGASDVSITLDQLSSLSNADSGNISLDIDNAGDYLFVLDGSDNASPTLVVSSYTAAYLESPAYVRGTMNSWGTDNPLVYQGGGKYKATITLATDSYQFKIADADWANVNFGTNEGALSIGSGLELASGAGDLSITITTAGDYDIVFDVLNEASPTLTISKTPSANCGLVDSSETGLLGSTPLYVRGDLSGWAPVADYQLSYKGDNIYQAKFSFEGLINFKLADDSDDWDIQYFVGINGAIEQGLQAGTTYTMNRGDGGTDNNSITLGVSEYTFTLTLNDPLVTDGEAGSFVIEQCAD